VQLLTPQTVNDPRWVGRSVLLAPQISGYPFTAEQIAVLAAQPGAELLPGGLVMIRLSPTALARLRGE
jgi:hypothetical protein